MFQPQEFLRKKRDGEELSTDDIRAFIDGIGTGVVGEAQIGAYTMATYLNGMTTREIVDLVMAMRDSGTVADWSAAGIDPARVIEKHSSGGVGDEKITLLVVPIVASAGVFIPNMSAWGLDYCPGEIDMLDSVPGYDGAPSVQSFVDTVVRTGGAIIGPSPELAPADGTIFKVRDTTATVESVALITGSIMSKKLAANPSGVVISVGCGDGAFMHTLDRARELANSMSNVASGAGIPSVIMITELNSVLGTTVGSAVEMIETVDFLTGAERDPRVLELVLELTSEIIVMAGLASDLAAGRAIALDELTSGRAAERFGRILAAQGCPADFVERARDYLPVAAVIRPVFASGTDAGSGTGSDAGSGSGTGFVEWMDTTDIGLTLVELGGGRQKPEDDIDFTVGFSEFVQLGDEVSPERALCVVHARTEDEWQRAAARIRADVRVVANPAPGALPIIIEKIAGAPASGAGAAA
ncbi:thymidine phosphorylase [Herbiconiux daphne]|uniref:Thymidine phosphorylase n=1 Tax=Herbiconiux daphne TaxID=2970914 RepID=A0ABT2H361_9MICO|nr:thymidine phosphorylase [Herbiconiux daphne]MCS5734357.1 thymidine phosphorylase [Herbiconiux daphne]